ncbi:hypothetical protein ACI78V_01575 [Geodermatophilus sp. SYSU D00742]
MSVAEEPRERRWSRAGGALVAVHQRPTSGVGERAGMQLPDVPGAVVVSVPAGRVLRRCRARRADLVLVVLAGRPVLSLGDDVPRVLARGGTAVCPRGTAWSLRAGERPARVVVVAFPAGPERAVADLAHRPALDDAARVALAADGGLELVLEPT